MSIYSVGGCISENFAEYIHVGKHNGYWLFDSPKVVLEIARENKIDLAEAVLFFYEVYELQFDSGQLDRGGPDWHEVEPRSKDRIGFLPCTRLRGPASSDRLSRDKSGA